MEKSAEDRLRNAILERVPHGSLVLVESTETNIEVKAEEDSFLKLSLYRGEWMVQGKDGHAHLKSFEESIDLVVAFLRGEARFANEYREDVLAAAWIEIWDGEAYAVRHQAMYLSPFERDEWVLIPGETWKVVRNSYVLTGSGLDESSFERLSPDPTAASPMFDSLNIALGLPEEGARWAFTGRGRFIVQIPTGWRRRPWEKTLPPNQADFCPENSELVYRSRNYFRTAENPGPAAESPLKPSSVEYKFENPSKTDAGWVAHSWTLLFSDGDEEMMGIIELFAPIATPEEAEALLPLIERLIHRSRYVSEGWSMGTDPSKD